METARYFEDLGVGEVRETPGRTVTEADLVRFAGISGHHEALDLSGREASLAPAVPDDMIVALTSGLGFRAAMPQPQILAFMALEWRFHGRVRLGDTVRCRTQITGKRGLKDGGVVVEKREIVNQRGELVQEGEYKLLVARRPAG